MKGEREDHRGTVRLSTMLLDAQTGVAIGERCSCGVRQLRMNSISDRGHVDLATGVMVPATALSERYTIQKGDVLFANTNSAELVGRAGLITTNLDHTLFSNHLTRLRTDPDKLDPAWLTEWLLWKWRSGQFKSIITRFVGQSSIATAQLLALKIPLYTVERQNKEVATLQTLDAVIESAFQLIEQTRRLKAAIAQDLLINAVREKRFPVAQTRLGNLFTERNEKGRPGLPTMAITMNDGIMDREDMDRRIESALTPEEHLLACKGDLAYNMMRMWQGVSGLVPQDSLISPAYVVVTPIPAIDPEFAAHLFKLPEMIRLFHRYSQGLTNDRLRLYYHQFAEIPVTLPKNKADQHRIARLLTQLEQTAQAQETRLAQLQRTKTAISNQIFSHV